MGQVARADDEVSLLREALLTPETAFCWAPRASGFSTHSKPQLLSDSCMKKIVGLCAALAKSDHADEIAFVGGVLRIGLRIT